MPCDEGTPPADNEVLGGAEAISSIIAAAPHIRPDDEAEIARLAKLSPIECDRELPASAEKLGCRVSTLRAAVAAKRGNGAISGQGRPLDLPDPDPWRAAVGGANLLDELSGAIRRYVVLDPHEADAAALWTIGAHAFDAWTIFPRLFVTAPEKGCGKSTLLDVLSRSVPRPLGASSISAAALFRTIEAAHPTLLLDEADTYARDDEDLRGILDGGHRRDGAVIRTVGDNHEPRQFSAWAPAALAAIGHLPGTIEDRSIIIPLRRRRPDEPVESLRFDRASELEDLARKAARWARDHVPALAAADPEMPDGIHNRAADNWRPLLAVADLAGGDWPERARQAALALMAGGDDEVSLRVELLEDIRDAFAERAADRLSSDELVAYLGSLDERRWPEFRGGKPITKAQVARLLKGFGVSSGSVRLPDGRTPKGYYRSAFADAFARYLPPSQNATTPQPAENKGEREISKRHNGAGEEGLWRFENAENASNSAGCGVVADSTPLDGGSSCDDARDRRSRRPDRCNPRGRRRHSPRRRHARTGGTGATVGGFTRPHPRSKARAARRGCRLARPPSRGAGALGHVPRSRSRATCLARAAKPLALARPSGSAPAATSRSAVCQH